MWISKRNKRTIAIWLCIALVLACIPNTNSKAASNPYPAWNDSAHTTRSCTSIAWQKAKEALGVELPGNWGNAGSWYSSAQAAGYSVGGEARKDSIAVWTGGTYGHVAYVLDVNSSNNSFYIYEGGNKTSYGSPGVGSRWIYNGNEGSGKRLAGFIYLSGSGGSSGNRDPVGYVDEIRSENEMLIVRGWAYDPDSPDTFVSIHVYVGDRAGTGASCYTTDINSNDFKAHVYRPDLGHAWGYELWMNVKERGNQNVYVYAINNEGGNNPELSLTQGVSRQVFINSNPWGSVDDIAVENGKLFIRGWVYDPDSEDKPVSVHVYVGDKAGTGAPCYSKDTDNKSITANIYRPDLKKNWGFEARIDVKEKGRQNIYLYAINNEGGNNPGINLTDGVNRLVDFGTKSDVPSITPTTAPSPSPSATAKPSATPKASPSASPTKSPSVRSTASPKPSVSPVQTIPPASTVAPDDQSTPVPTDSGEDDSHSGQTKKQINKIADSKYKELIENRRVGSSHVYYRIADITFDGIHEALIEHHPLEGGSGRIFEIFTYQDGQIKSMLNMEEYGLSVIDVFKKSKGFVMECTGHGAESYWYYKKNGLKYHLVATKGRSNMGGDLGDPGPWGYQNGKNKKVSKAKFLSLIKPITKGKKRHIGSNKWKYLDGVSG